MEPAIKSYNDDTGTIEPSRKLLQELPTSLTKIQRAPKRRKGHEKSSHNQNSAICPLSARKQSFGSKKLGQLSPDLIPRGTTSALWLYQAFRLFR